MTTVVNMRVFTIGSGHGVVIIDRRSRWGNPYMIGEVSSDPDSATPYSRADVLFLYRQWLSAKLRDDPDFLEPLRSKILACWCAPEPCHGDIIKEYLDATAQ